MERVDLRKEHRETAISVKTQLLTLTLRRKLLLHKVTAGVNPLFKIFAIVIILKLLLVTYIFVKSNQLFRELGSNLSFSFCQRNLFQNLT